MTAQEDAATGERPPLSSGRLREAFAALLGQRPADPGKLAAEPGQTRQGEAATAGGREAPCEISPRAIVEALLFVGRPDNQPLTAREIAAVMRDVSPQEVEAAIAELNQSYADEGAAYTIVASGGAYRLALRDDCSRLRDRFYGRWREAKLSPPAVEVLSIVAYNQPITLDDINEIRGASSGGVLSTLVRRQLVKLERPSERPRKPDYRTTERFLRFFRLSSLDDLPQVEDLDAA